MLECLRINNNVCTKLFYAIFDCVTPWRRSDLELTAQTQRRLQGHKISITPCTMYTFIMSEFQTVDVAPYTFLVCSHTGSIIGSLNLPGGRLILV